MPSTKENLISIDPSTSCTGICINGEVSCFTRRDIAYTKKDKPTKWFEMVSNYAIINSMDTPLPINKLTFSESERYKIEKYDYTTDCIIEFIIKNHIPSVQTNKCVIEGYSYSSDAGHIIDLVTFSTLLRRKIIDLGYTLYVVPPSELKMASAKLTYNPIDIGKKKPKLRWENKDGVPGGSFKKHEMYKAIIDNKNINNKWQKFLQSNKDDILPLKKIPTPIDDINDAFLLYHAFKANVINT